MDDSAKAARAATTIPGDGRYAAITPTPVGLIGIRMHGEALAAIDFLGARAAPVAPESDAAREVLDQLHHYFEAPGWRFALALAPLGSAFQQRVWSALRDIPAGETRTYGELAAKLQSSARAVGGACRRNPLPIVVPCHRVVAAAGVGGFMGARSGAPLAIKQWLLAHEAPPPWSSGA